MRSLMVLLMLTTSVSAECLSKREARDRWPKRHIYWHTADHCWDASPSRRLRALAQEPPSPPTPASVPLPKPIAVKHWGEAEDYCCWPDLEVLLKDIKGFLKEEK